MKRISLSILTILLLFIVACNGTGNAPDGSITGLEPEATAVSEPTEAPTVVAEAETADDPACPENATDMLVLQDATHGFCLFYPADYQVVADGNNVSLVKDSLLNVTDPRLSINIEEANGRTTSEVAAAIARIWQSLQV